MPFSITVVRADSRHEQVIETTTTGLDLFGADKRVVAMRVDGDLLDLQREIPEGAVVEAVEIDSPDGLNILRHSTGHVTAQALQNLFADAKLGIGPPITDGYYYDFQVQPLDPDDLKAIEKRMGQIIKEKQRFVRRVVSDDEARAELASEPFKLELISDKSTVSSDDASLVEVGGHELTMYDNVRRDGSVAWKDLCRGPHVPDTSYIRAYSVTRASAAYWRGDQSKAQLQRVYGTAWPTRDDLAAYEHRQAEAARRDHRKLGLELDLFSFPEELGAGLPVFHPKGGVIKRVMEDYVRQQHIEYGFDYVGTPHIAREQLYYTSGHLPYYGDFMFPPIDDDGQNYRLKAMNCPMHNLIYASRGRSYRELPMRLFEFGTVYRNEKSGVLQGLTRVRSITQDDSHSYVTSDQVADEIRHLLTFVLKLLRDFGLTDFYLELSTRDEDGKKKDKFLGTDEQWAVATATLEEVGRASGLDLVADPGGAAFYGPKISVQAKDAIGRTWQMSTIQLDFMQPERFGLTYTAPDGSHQTPVMIHSAKFGSIERFLGVLTEHYAGAFPAWLAPVQVLGVPVADEFTDYLRGFLDTLAASGVRVELDSSDDRFGKKIRNAAKQKVPFILIAGGDDRDAGAISFRYRDGSQSNQVPLDEAASQILAHVAARRNDDPVAPSPIEGCAVVTEPSDGSEDADLFAGVPDAFQRLWTPHRMAYIGGESKPGSADEPDCPFCRAPRHSDERGLIVARGDLAYVVMNLYPYSPGHLLVCPYRHVAGYIDATTAEVDEVARLTRIAIRALSRVSHPQGFNLGMNQGAVGGAGIQAHLHQHVVPRWLGDTNFLPIVAQTRAVPQLLSAGRELLAEAWGVATDEEDDKERHA